MLNEQEQAELAELEAKVAGKTAETSDLTRLAELQEKAEQSEVITFSALALDEMTAKDLKELAKDAKVKGYGNMNKEQLIEALNAEPAKTEKPNGTLTDKLVKEGYTYHGTNGRNSFYQSPDGKAVMVGADGKLNVCGNKFGDDMLKKLKK